MARYSVEFTSKNHPTNVDGLAVGLRVHRDGKYFQFFLPVVSAPSLADRGDPLTGRWWAALVSLGVDEVERRLREGVDPNEDRSQGILVPIPSDDVAHLERSEVPLADFPDEAFFGGVQVAEFEA